MLRNVLYDIFVYFKSILHEMNKNSVTRVQFDCLRQEYNGVDFLLFRALKE